MPYLIDDASPANSETTLMSTVFGSAYFDSVVVANVVMDACVVLLPLLLLSVADVLIRVVVPTLLPFPSSRCLCCCFGEWFADGAVDFTVHTDVYVLSVVSCLLSSVELDCDAVDDDAAVAAADAGAIVVFATDTAATTSVFCVMLAFAFCPCSEEDAVAGSTLFNSNLLCRKETRNREKKI